MVWLQLKFGCNKWFVQKALNVTNGLFSGQSPLKSTLLWWQKYLFKANFFFFICQVKFIGLFLI